MSTPMTGGQLLKLVMLSRKLNQAQPVVEDYWEAERVIHQLEIRCNKIKRRRDARLSKANLKKDPLF